MSPVMQETLASKRDRRARLMALPYPEKVRIVEQLRAAVSQIKTAAKPMPSLSDTPAFGR